MNHKYTYFLGFSMKVETKVQETAKRTDTHKKHKRNPIPPPHTNTAPRPPKPTVSLQQQRETITAPSQ